MAKTLLDLANYLDRVADGLDDTLKDAKTAVATAVVSDLINKTPVDTSKALSNWRVSAGSALEGHIAALVPGSRGSTRGASASQALAAAVAAIEAGRPEELLVIFNNVPYIKRLSEGYSAQAPAGWVERAVLIGRSVARRYKVTLPR